MHRDRRLLTKFIHALSVKLSLLLQPPLRNLKRAAPLLCRNRAVRGALPDSVRSIPTYCAVQQRRVIAGLIGLHTQQRELPSTQQQCHCH